MSFNSNRQRMIYQRGRPMTLNRLSGSEANGGTIITVSLPLTGFLAAYMPEQILGEVRDGDATVYLTNDEIANAGWTPPQARDQFIIDGKTWFVQGSNAVFDGFLCIGHCCWVRGGAG